jgi:Tfp pilus assembly protein PilF
VRNGFLCLFATALILGNGGGPLGPGGASSVQAAPKSESSSPSFGQSISGGFKSGVKKLSDAFTPEPSIKAPDDPVSLSTKARPSPELYVSMGQLAEQQNKPDNAERRYQEALKLNPKHLGALVAYARFKDRQEQFDEALRLYQQAAKTHPDQAVVFNDLGLCYARHKRLNEALPHLERAVQLKPKEVLYRNNLATVLVELGDVDRAFEHLTAVHDEASAYYNLGYLLQQKGRTNAAVVLFTKALEKNPSMTEARLWLERLGGTPQPPSPQGVPQTVQRFDRGTVGVDDRFPRRTLPATTVLAPGAPETTVPGPNMSRWNRPPAPAPGRVLPSDNRVEDAPLPPPMPSSEGMIRGQDVSVPGPEMAPLPPSRPLPSPVHPLPPVVDVVPEP